MNFSVNNIMLNSVSDFAKINSNSKSEDEQKTNLIQNSTLSIFADKEIKSESNIALKDLEALNENNDDIKASRNEVSEANINENEKDDSKPVKVDETNCDKVMPADVAKVYRGAINSGKVAGCDCQYKDGTMLFTDENGNIKMEIAFDDDYMNFEIINFFEGRRAQGIHWTKDQEQAPILADEWANPNKDKWASNEVIFELYSAEFVFNKMIDDLDKSGFDFSVA